MKRHVLGISVFLIVFVVTVGLSYAVHSISKGIDSNAVPPISDERIVLVSSNGIPTDAVFVQYELESNTLIAQLRLNSQQLNSSSHLYVTARVFDDQSPDKVETRLLGISRSIFKGDGTIEVHLQGGLPGFNSMEKNRNYFAAFRVGSYYANSDSLSRSDFGSPASVVFVHGNRSVNQRKQGPDILE